MIELEELDMEMTDREEDGMGLDPDRLEDIVAEEEAGKMLAKIRLRKEKSEIAMKLVAPCHHTLDFTRRGGGNLVGLEQNPTRGAYRSLLLKWLLCSSIARLPL